MFMSLLFQLLKYVSDFKHGNVAIIHDIMHQRDVRKKDKWLDLKAVILLTPIRDAARSCWQVRLPGANRMGTRLKRKIRFRNDINQESFDFPELIVVNTKNLWVCQTISRPKSLICVFYSASPWTSNIILIQSNGGFGLLSILLAHNRL